MISARDWERNVDYQLVFLGGALLGGAVAPRLPTRVRRLLPPVAAAALVACACVLVRAQWRVFEFFLPANQASVAMKRALDRLEPRVVRDVVLVMDDPSLAPLLQFRVHRPLDALIDYTRVYSQRISPLADSEGDWGLRSPFRERLFEYFARTGRGPEEVDLLLRKEAEQRSGFFLAFLFSMKDYWYPTTFGKKKSKRWCR
jgi:hypothetical protein